VFTLNDLPAQLDAKMVERLLKAEPATIGHFRNSGFMDPGIRAMQTDLRIAGPAVTVRAPGMDGTIVGYALGQVRRGDVLVIDRAGDLSAVTTKRIGLAGEFCVPVSCGGVAVNPGDVIIADECGIVVLDRAEAQAAAERAIGMQEAETGSRKRLDAGEKLPDISGATKVLQEALAKQKP
jgi:4-hydroxy-4-methyl-2-oxoglutarate aldolase